MFDYPCDNASTDEFIYKTVRANKLCCSTKAVAPALQHSERRQACFGTSRHADWRCFVCCSCIETHYEGRVAYIGWWPELEWNIDDDKAIILHGAAHTVHPLCSLHISHTMLMDTLVMYTTADSDRPAQPVFFVLVVAA